MTQVVVVTVLVATVLVAVATETIPLVALAVEGLVVEEVVVATLVAVATTTLHQQTRDPFVWYARRGGTQLTGAGTDLKKALSLKKEP
jgi:hypothetical protein